MLVLTLVFVCTVATGIAAPIVVRALPEPVDGATARSYLSQLTVADESNSPAYSRTLFKTWDTSKQSQISAHTNDYSKSS